MLVPCSPFRNSRQSCGWPCGLASPCRGPSLPLPNAATSICGCARSRRRTACRSPSSNGASARQRSCRSIMCGERRISPPSLKGGRGRSIRSCDFRWCWKGRGRRAFFLNSARAGQPLHQLFPASTGGRRRPCHPAWFRAAAGVPRSDRHAGGGTGPAVQPLGLSHVRHFRAAAGI